MCNVTIVSYGYYGYILDMNTKLRRIDRERIYQETHDYVLEIVCHRDCCEPSRLSAHRPCLTDWYFRCS